MAMNSQTLSNEQVLIVGCGDIGRRFAEKLPDSYRSILGLRRNPWVDTGRLRYEQCDVTDAEQLDSVLKQSDFGVILVTMTPGARTDAGYEIAYVKTCKNLIAGLKKYQRKPRLLVFVSSTGVYGQDDGSWVDEGALTQPKTFSGRRLLEAEQIILESGFVCIVARFSGIYGADRRRLIDQVLHGRAQLSAQITNRIHIDDGVAALVHLVELHRKGDVLASIYVVTDSVPAPLKEVLTWLAQQLEKGLVAAPEGAMAELGNKSCSNQRLLATGFRLSFPGYKEGYAAMLREINSP